jgi:hypothetical protein
MCILPFFFSSISFFYFRFAFSIVFPFSPSYFFLLILLYPQSCDPNPGSSRALRHRPSAPPIAVAQPSPRVPEAPSFPPLLLPTDPLFLHSFRLCFEIPSSLLPPQADVHGGWHARSPRRRGWSSGGAYPRDPVRHYTPESLACPRRLRGTVAGPSIWAAEEEGHDESRAGAWWASGARRAGGARDRATGGDHLARERAGIQLCRRHPEPSPSVSIASGLLRGAARVKYAAGHLLLAPNRRTPFRARATAGGTPGKRRGAVTGAGSLFGWLVADGWCWFVLREEYCWLVAAGCWWLVRSERKYCWLVADKPSEQALGFFSSAPTFLLQSQGSRGASPVEPFLGVSGGRLVGLRPKQLPELLEKPYQMHP